MPNGGFRMVLSALKAYGYEPDPHVVEAFTKYRKTHNEGVFDAYTADIRRCRSSHVLTGLPDAYGRGRIIGDYRRVALYGVDRLIERKQQEKSDLDPGHVDRRDHPRPRGARRADPRAQGTAADGRELRLRHLAARREPRREAVQWLYFGYLAAVKEQNGAAMSLGRTSTFLDIYFERDLAAGVLTEEQAQEIIDDFVIKLRIVRFLRTPEYDELFAGDPTWVTESIGGMGDDGRSLVTKTSFRFLQTLYNLGPAPEPNLTIWYSPRLPDGFRRFAAKVAIDTSSLQFESDEIMRRTWGDDGAIACCVSPMLVGKQMQFFGARANLAKCLLYAINGGRDEISGEQVGPAFEPVKGDYLDFDDVIAKFEKMMDWLAGVYVNAMNVIHYMHDKYAYERIEMALHDYAPLRTMAFGMAGMSVVADSLSAIKYAKVRVVRDETGLVTDYQTEGEFPMFGNNDNRVDQLAAWVVSTFMNKLRKYPTYRNALHTQSILTITSNVVYGKATGNTPDGRRHGRAVRAGRQPDARPRQPRHPRRGGLGRQDSLSRRRRRHLADDDPGAERSRASGRGPHHQSHRHARRVLQRHRLSHERERAEPRHAARRDGSSGEVPEPDDPRLGLRGQLRAAHARAADGRDQPHLPRRRRPCLNIQTLQQTPLGGEEPVRAPGQPRQGRSGTDVRSALATGDMGFLHSFTTGSAVDGPGVRVVAWTTGCMWRCRYCHNPDTWTMSNGIPVTVAKATEELRKYRHGLKVMSGGFTLSGGEPLMQHRFAVKLFAAAQAMGIHTAHRDQRLLRRPAHRRRARDDRPGAARHQDLGSGAPPAAHGHGHRPDAGVRAPARGPPDGRSGFASCWCRG